VGGQHYIIDCKMTKKRRNKYQPSVTLIPFINHFNFKAKIYALVAQVFIPNMEYKGQNEMREVNTKIPPRITNTRPIVPVTVPEK
jgi:hypothetical protein